MQKSFSILYLEKEKNMPTRKYASTTNQERSIGYRTDLINMSSYHVDFVLLYHPY